MKRIVRFVRTLPQPTRAQVRSPGPLAPVVASPAVHRVLADAEVARDITATSRTRLPAATRSTTRYRNSPRIAPMPMRSYCWDSAMAVQ